MDKAAAEKEAYLAHVGEIRSLGGMLPGESKAKTAGDGTAGVETGDEKELQIPVARTRKILSLDEDINHLR